MSASKVDKAALAAGKVQTALLLLQPALRNFIAQAAPGTKTKKLDVLELLKFIQKNWNTFSSKKHPESLKKNVDRAYKVRNRVSHQSLPLEDCQRALETLSSLAQDVGGSEIAGKIDQLRSELFVQPTLPKEVESKPSEPTWQQLKEQGNLAYNQGKWTEAMILYSSAIFIDPTPAVLYSNRALCELKLGKYQLAREDAEEAIERDSTNNKYFRILSQALEHLELYEEAQGVCQQGLAIDPRDGELLLRVRNCKARQSIKEIDNKNVPHGTSESTPEQMMAKFSSFVQNLSSLTPRPSEIQVLELQELNLRTKSQKLVVEAHNYRDGLYGKPKDPTKALSLYESAAKLGNAEAIYNLSCFYDDGMAGLPADFARGLELLQQVVQQKPFFSFNSTILPNTGVAEAENAFGIAYRDGRGVDVDPVTAFSWFKKSAEHNCPAGQNNLGYCLDSGTGTQADVKSARVWYQRAAEAGLAEAQINLALLLENGLGGPRDLQSAHELYKKAVQQGDSRALVGLQRIERIGAFGGSTLSKSSPHLTSAADKNDPIALFLLGQNYYEGAGGFEKDWKAAEDAWRKAAKLGNLEAQVELADLLLNHLKRNKEGFEMIHQAAEQGHAPSQMILGDLYACGHGCTRDATKARRWFLRAQAQTKEAQNIEEHIRIGEDMCRFESEKALSSDNLTLQERIFRRLKGKEGEEQIIDQLQHLMSLGSPSPTNTVASEPIIDEERMDQLVKRAEAGSVTAQRVLAGMDNMLNAYEQITSGGSVPEALKSFRDGLQLWDNAQLSGYIVDTILSAAASQLDRNPNDPNSLLISAHYLKGSLEERFRFIKRCVELHPKEPHFHIILGSTYVSFLQYEHALRCFNRALELQNNPEFLYYRAMAVRFLSEKNNTNNFDEVIAAYEAFLKANPPDHRKVPEAHYAIAFQHWCAKRQGLAREHFDKAQIAESPPVRLPVFKPVTDFPLKIKLQMIFSSKSLCSYCGIEPPNLKRCPCLSVQYCGQNCQRQHWKTHKLLCKSKQ